MTTQHLDPAQPDGRRLRREQNRTAVLDALAGLLRAGQQEPSSAEIAAAAGLSPRSLFRYFEDIDELRRAAVLRMFEQTPPLRELPASPQAPTEVKIARFVQARVLLFEEVAPLARVLRAAADGDDVLEAVAAQCRALLLGQITELFASELAQVSDPILPAVDVLCSFGTYDRLRRVSGLSAAGVMTTLVTSLTSLLTAAVGRPESPARRSR